MYLFLENLITSIYFLRTIFSNNPLTSFFSDFFQQKKKALFYIAVFSQNYFPVSNQIMFLFSDVRNESKTLNKSGQITKRSLRRV